LAVIPARGGSKRVPRKNIRLFHGKPMMVHVLNTARDAAIFDEIHVSTDDQEIAEIARANGFPPAFMRPAELSDDQTALMPVLRSVVESYESVGDRFDTIALLYATAALVEADDLRTACSQFESADRRTSLISVAKFAAPIEWAYRLAPDGRLQPVNPGAFATDSKNLDEAFYDTAGFIFFDRTTVLENIGAGTDQNFRAYVLPRHKAVDVDTSEDWALAEQMFELLRKSNG
jgi:N-acylneuraminate cytidylyltransferase